MTSDQDLHDARLQEAAQAVVSRSGIWNLLKEGADPELAASLKVIEDLAKGVFPETRESFTLESTLTPGDSFGKKEL